MKARYERDRQVEQAEALRAASPGRFFAALLEPRTGSAAARALRTHARHVVEFATTTATAGGTTSSGGTS
jgi:hypothetical protein